MKKSNWQNCYSEQWAGILIPPAFAHPAKISLALVRKIFTHALKNGWINKGDTCLDPFAGIGGVAFGAMAAGLKFVGQELEPHFVELANGMECTPEKLCPTCKERSEQAASKNGNLFDEVTGNHHFEGNLEFWQRKFSLTGAVILQGDSRRLLENLREQVECVVSSPPFGEAQTGGNSIWVGAEKLYKRKYTDRSKTCGYLKNLQCKISGNLGNLPTGNFDAVISSPPYINSISGNDHGIDSSKIKDGGTNRTAAREAIGTGYGESPAKLGSMPEGRFDITVSSPPFEDNGTNLGGVGNTNSLRQQIHNSSKRDSAYGKTENQLGNYTGETFWTASREIVQQCFLALKPGGHAIWVTKRFVRNGEIVEFSKQWAQLCEAVGFKVVCWHHAMLTQSGAIQMAIDGKETQRIKERKSFFRRIAEKNGSPRIDWEDVICMVKPKNAL